MNVHGWSVMKWYSNHVNHPSGRILLLWDDNQVVLNVVYSSHQLVHCIVTVYGFKMEISAIYEFNDEAGRRTLWDDIRRLHSSISCPWLLMGDFNAIPFQDERLGKQVPSPKRLDNFNCLIVDVDIFEMAYKGPWFT